jgi:DNA-binding CsgD family transcriptional regulator
VTISRFVTEWLLPALACPCCGQVTVADAPPGLHPGTICYGPGVNTAAVLLSGYGNVPAERATHLIGMLLGVPVSPGFVDKASARLDGKLQDAGFDEAMEAALAAEPALGADETPVNVLAPAAHPETGEPETGSPHVLVIRPPGGKLTWLRALGSRRHEAITGILSFFTGFLICDGYEAYPKLLPQLAGLQQCCQHIIRRTGRRREAREPLRSGLELARTCGAAPLAERAEGELRATGASPRNVIRVGVDSLTTSERRVSQMAASGMSNKQIAQALFVTVKTVETHLSRSYQKLDVSSRARLAAALRAQP